MRLLILILLLPFIAQGQIVRTHPYYKPSVSSCSYLLDQYTGAAAAYSLRKLDCDYAGSAIRVRRSSDNTEQDIGFVNGNLDTASLKTFVGTGGTDDGFVVTWYDQSGNSLNATQSTSGNQPLIMDNGVILRDGGSPCITGDGSDDRLNFSPTISSNLIYCFVAAKRQSGGTNEGRIIGFSLGDAHDWSNTNGWAALTVSTASNTVYSYRNNASVASVSVTIGTRYLYYSYLNGSGGAIATNNNSPTTGSTSSTSVNITKAGIFAAPWATSGGNFKGNIQEVIVYTSDQSSNRTSINSNINTYYSIYCTDADAQAFIDSAGITDQTQKDAICTLVRELKDSSLWSSFNAIYPFVGGTASTHKWNLKNPQNTDAAFRLVFNGTWSHSSSGADPNGTNAFGNTYYSATGNGSFSDYAISVYLTENTTVGSYPIDIGASNSGSNLSMDLSINRPSDGNKSASASGNWTASGTVLYSSAANTTAGYILSTRRGLSDFEIYKNGASLASTTTTVSSVTINANYYLGAANNNGTTSNYSNRNIAFATVGAGLTDDQVRALNTIVEKFNDALGRGVQ